MYNRSENPLDQEDFQKIENYCKQHQVQVLYLMLVEMEGFTLAEETELSGSVQEQFDELIENQIAPFSGFIAKKLNNNQLILFHSPESAVRAALEIQASANSENGIKFQMKVALHAGQALVGNKVNQVIFKQQLNIISNLEKITPTGHIYLSAHVYIGAGSWLDEQSPYTISHKKHGRYYLPQAQEYVEIFEVSKKKIVSLEAPHISRKRKISFMQTRNIFTVVIALIIILAVTRCRKPSVYLLKSPDTEIYLNSNHKLLSLEEYREDDSRKVETRLLAGKYVFYYDDNSATRNYASIRIKKGKNKIKPHFRKQKLPRLQKKISLSAANNWQDVELANRRWHYGIYNKNNVMINHDAEIDVSLRGEGNSLEREFTIRWRFDLDGASINVGEKNYTSDTEETITLHKDKLHFIELNITIEADKAVVNLNSTFADYRK